MTQQLIGARAPREVSRPVRDQRTGRGNAGKTRAAPRRHLASAVTCPRCQAINAHPGRRCLECSAVLLTPQISEAEKQAQRQATGKLRRVSRTLAGITWLYRAGALAHAVVAGIAIFALQREDVPREAGILVVGLSTGMSVLMLMGAIQILFKPFVWTLILAALATGVSVTHLVGPDPLGLMALWSAGWAVLFWLTAWPTLRIRRTIAEHTDLYVTHHTNRRTRHALERRTPEARHRRLMDVMHRALLHSWRVSAAAGVLICLASALGSHLVLTHLRPAEFTTTLPEFERAWNHADLTAVAGFFPFRNRPGEYALLDRLAAGHGWRESRPPLEGGRVRHDDELRWVDYELDAGSVTTRWMLMGQEWFLTAIELPTPPLDVTLQRFLEAWSTSDPRALAEFYPDEYVERMTKSIEYSTRRRGWNSYPDALGTLVQESTEKTAVVILTVTRGEVITKWLFRRSGKWFLQGLEFPEHRGR